jgi:hypothetical protein
MGMFVLGYFTGALIVLVVTMIYPFPRQRE